ncbi:baseplate J/gp47 family protein [Lactobacillus crispatus]|uniref:baseplate assembly protein n=1 Tax=Lactobacillus crispatus TaxID=47770 RepID=UPI0029C1A2C2|nr:baseplate J/gp47 family protein [Lactobacillus crispatus]MDX5091598.1 baseplate J/gp47 family protein [Lactobacillus crispatus]
MNRFNLPDIQFAQKSAEQIEADAVARFEENTDITLTKADPRRKFIQTDAYMLALQRSLIDYTGKQNLLAYAENENLDHIGARAKTPRLEALAARTTQRFHLSIAKPQTIPEGTRVSAGDGIFFATLESVEVAAGQTFVDVMVECTVMGSIGDGYLPGQLNQLVDPLQWVQSVQNLTTSAGGADTEADDPYAERIWQAPESFSVAGPEGAYKYWARTASPSIVDVAVDSPAPCEIEIRPLLQGGQIPTQEVLDQVMEVCNDRKIRPLSDLVKVLAPEQVNYDLSVTYWIGLSSSGMATSIKAKIEKAIDEFIQWQKSKLGRDIDPSELTARIKMAGAKRAAVTLPMYRQIAPHQVAKENQVQVVYGGLEDD